MPNPSVPTEFEAMIRNIADVPEPDAKFVDRLRTSFISGGGSSARVKPVSRTSINLKRAFVAAFIVVIALLATSPAVATALKTLLGYIPGVGLVDQSATVLVLAEPVVVQRDGVTLTVEQAVATAEKTVVIYRHVETTTNQPAQNYAMDPPALRLPDGSKLNIVVGRRLPTDGAGILYALDFGPLPPNVDEVTLELVTLAGLRPGEGPENWQVPIRFKVGDSSQLTFPVFEYESTPTVADEQPAYGISITLDKVVELPDGYILMGVSQWTDDSIPSDSLDFDILAMTDANGKTVEYEYAQSERFAEFGELRKYWAYKILTKEFAAPLKLDFYILHTVPSDARFQFSPGPDPQNGQIWDLNIDVLVNDRVVRVVSAEYSDQDPDFHYFRFTMTSDADVTGARIIDIDHPPLGFGGGGVPATNVAFTSTVRVEGEIPAGPLYLSIVSLQALVAGDWTITWDPSQP